MSLTAQRELTVAGVMTGTSADGIDVAILRIRPQDRAGRIKLLAHRAFPFSAGLRARVVAAMNDDGVSVPELARLGTRLGMAYAEAVEKTQKASRLRVDLVGCHGQTIYHQATPASYLARRVATTWQLLDPSPVSARFGVPVVSDFRPADIAAGGQGAPLVPLFDYEMFHHATRNRVLLNLGGIANITVIPANAQVSDVFAFDTGPANMVIDALTQQLLRRPMDRGGATAARGRTIESVVADCLRQRFFRKPPPKSAGREQFGADFTAAFLRDCHRHSRSKADAIASATWLTARSVTDAVMGFAIPLFGEAGFDCVLSGGGANNATLRAMLAQLLAPVRGRLLTSADLGMPVSAKEAAAFALLAWNTWHGLPGNLPSATGARCAVVLGRVSHA